jgi:hypothetical protein
LIKQSIGIFIVVLVGIGVKLWHRSASYQEVNSQLLEFCKGYTQCKRILSENFDHCFNSHYDIDKSGCSGHLDQAAFV